MELTPSSKNVLPLNYQYELSSWIYHILNNGDPVFSEWLHNQGFTDSNKHFRLFTFSNLIISNRHIRDDRLIIGSRRMQMILSVLPVETIKHFITGLFREQCFSLGDSITQISLLVSQVESLPETKISNCIDFICLSPIVISLKKEKDRYAQYLSPEHPDYGELLIKNLKEKWKAFTKDQFDFDESGAIFRLLSPVYKKGITIKAGKPDQTKIVGYLFTFHLEAPAELLRIGYYAGFGEKNSIGFGCGEVINKN